MVIVAGIGSALINAITNVYLKKLFDNGSIRELAPLNFFLNAIMLLIFCPFFYYFNPSPRAVVILLGIFILDTLANYFFYLAIESSEVSYTSIFMSLSPIFTLFIATFFISVISINTLIAIVGILSSIYILNLNSQTSALEPFKNLFQSRNYYGILIAAFTGAGAVLTKIAFNEDMINPATLYMFRSIFIFIIFTILFRPNISNLSPKIVLNVWIRAVFVLLHILIYYYAISLGNVVIASTVSNTYPAFILILSYIMFKEKITIQKSTAILMIIFFISLLNFSL